MRIKLSWNLSYWKYYSGLIVNPSSVRSMSFSLFLLLFLCCGNLIRFPILLCFNLYIFCFTLHIHNQYENLVRVLKSVNIIVHEYTPLLQCKSNVVIKTIFQKLSTKILFLLSFHTLKVLLFIHLSLNIDALNKALLV